MDLKDFLYNRLPEIYRREDAKVSPSPYPLRRFLDLLTEGGLQTVLNYIEDFRSIQNVDEFPKELLPLIAQQYGLEFPYDMDEASQRKFIKVLPTLYANKGTEEAFKYLAREIFGEGTNLQANMAQKPVDMSDEDWLNSDDWHKLLVYLEINGETLKLENKHLNFIKFCEIIRPVNTTVIPYLALFYNDIYNRLSIANDNSGLDFVQEKNTEDYTANINDLIDYITARDNWGDIYKNSTMFSNRLNNLTSRLNNNILATAVGITDTSEDIISEDFDTDIRTKYLYEINIDNFKDYTEDNCKKEKVDSSVSLFIQNIIDDQRQQVLKDDIESSYLGDILYDVNNRAISDNQTSNNITFNDLDSFTKALEDVEVSASIKTPTYLDTYKNSPDSTTSGDFLEYNFDKFTDVFLERLKNYIEQSISETILDFHSQENYKKAVVDKVSGKFTRTRPSTYTNKLGVTLNSSFRTNDGDLRVVNMDF